MDCLFHTLSSKFSVFVINTLPSWHPHMLSLFLLKSNLCWFHIDPWLHDYCITEKGHGFRTSMLWKAGHVCVRRAECNQKLLGYILLYLVLILFLEKRIKTNVALYIVFWYIRQDQMKPVQVDLINTNKKVCPQVWQN